MAKRPGTSTCASRKSPHQLQLWLGWLGWLGWRGWLGWLGCLCWLGWLGWLGYIYTFSSQSRDSGREKETNKNSGGINAACPKFGSFGLNVILSYGLDGKGYVSRQRQKAYLFSKVSGLNLWPTQSPIQWEQGLISRG